MELEAEVVNKPGLRNLNMTPTSDEDIRNYSRMLVDIDDGVGLIVRALEEAKILDNTMIIFTSDNGYFFGEHGLTEKRLAYDEAIRVPFLVRYPPLVKAGSTSNVSILNIDIAPTLLSLADLPIPLHMEGRSLLPVFQGGELEEPRSSLLFEFFGPEQPGGKGGIQAWKAVLKNEWKYIHWTTINGADELYNLEEDPFEMNNLIKDDNHNMKLIEMQQELTNLMKEYNDPGELLQILLSITE
jgi:arylsulfatase A-like enzyme